MKDIVRPIHVKIDRLILRAALSFWAQNKTKIVTFKMESEIFPENFSLPDYPEHPDYSFDENYPVQSDGALSDLSVDYRALIERKIQIWECCGVQTWASE